MQPMPESIKQLRREGIEDARKMGVAQKLAAGGELFDYACTISLAGIRSQHPGISEADAMNELRRRLAIGRKLENRL
jgi:hypothetical protein